ncbi:hypothetical protein BayCH28_20910 [Mycolicibacterium sp. CH28]|uniref:hypothetical protein n=1 Tax=Mycolicibacterium sp. CH28 TaxID=2512237 RepID=UPI0010815B1C|nr:hypothetical protein [Mycolicibacterium sp. CH28]TGD85491.1 hypothetical protein BayCH28_20910 [Mycolicibacterium sp. CH28]
MSDEAHLDACAQCRAEAADFAPLPALVTKADPADLEPEPEVFGADALMLRKALTARRAARRRNRRMLVSGVVAADVTGVVTLAPRPWGTAISLDLQKLPTAGLFTLRTMDNGGRMHPAASWAATPDGVGLVEGATSIPMPKLRKLNIVDAEDRVLATMER